MRAWMSSKLDQIRQLVFMATDRVIMVKNGVATFSQPLFFHPILFILAGNNDMHKSSQKLEIPPDPTTVWGVSCP